MARLRKKMSRAQLCRQDAGVVHKQPNNRKILFEALDIYENFDIIRNKNNNIFKRPPSEVKDSQSVQKSCFTGKQSFGFFFLIPNPDRPKVRIRSGQIRIRIREKISYN